MNSNAGNLKTRKAFITLKLESNYKLLTLQRSKNILKLHTCVHMHMVCVLDKIVKIVTHNFNIVSGAWAQHFVHWLYLTYSTWFIMQITGAQQSYRLHTAWWRPWREGVYPLYCTVTIHLTLPHFMIIMIGAPSAVVNVLYCQEWYWFSQHSHIIVKLVKVSDVVIVISQPSCYETNRLRKKQFVKTVLPVCALKILRNSCKNLH